MIPDMFTYTDKLLFMIINNLFEIERKAINNDDPINISRNIERMKGALAELKLFYEDPMGQAFKDTRTDLDVSISGESTDDLVVVEVIKPIIRIGGLEHSKVIQKGIVVVKSKGEGKLNV